MKAPSSSFSLGVAVTCLVMAGCTSTGVDGHPHPEAQGNPSSAPATDGIPVGGGVSETSVPTRIPDARGLAFQEEILSDGEVTFAEYERAVFAVADCLEGLGLVVIGPGIWPDAPTLNISVGADPRLDYNWGYGAVGDVSAELDVAAVGCQVDWSEDVTLKWQEQNQPTELEIEQWIQAAIECGLAHGVVFSNPPKEGELVEVPLRFDDCRPWEAMVG